MASLGQLDRLAQRQSDWDGVVSWVQYDVKNMAFHKVRSSVEHQVLQRCWTSLWDVVRASGPMAAADLVAAAERSNLSQWQF